MQIGERITLAREAAAMTKSELARRVGVHPSACIQWESAGGTHPKVEHLAQVAAVLDVRFEWLATGRGEMRYIPGAGEERPAYGADAKLNAAERQAVEKFRTLSPRKRKLVTELLDVLAAAPKPKKSK